MARPQCGNAIFIDGRRVWQNNEVISEIPKYLSLSVEISQSLLFVRLSLSRIPIAHSTNALDDFWIGGI
jgi:hypothetical protein